MLPLEETKEKETFSTDESILASDNSVVFSVPGSGLECLIYNEEKGLFYLDQESGQFQHILAHNDLEKVIGCFIDSQNERLVMMYHKQAKADLEGRESNGRSGQDEDTYSILLFDLNSKQVISDVFCDLNQTQALPLSEHNLPM